MAMIPEQKDPHEHVYSLIADGMKKRIPIYDQNNNFTGYDYIIDNKSARYKTGIVNSPHYAAFAKDLEDFLNFTETARKFMTAERAESLAQDIFLHYGSFSYSIDAKSSETLRDKQNAQACLIDKGFRQKSERAITIKDEAKKSFFDAFTGKKKEETIYD